MQDAEILFSNYNFDLMLRALPGRLAASIEQLSDSELMTEDIDELIDRLVAEHLIVVPELDLKGITVSEAEVDVDVSNDRRRIFHSNGPHYVKMSQYSFFVPYSGLRDVFFCQPSTYGSNPPRAEVQKSEIVVRVLKQDATAGPDEIRKQFDEVVKRIDTNLDRLRNAAGSVATQLRQTAKTHIDQRRAKRQQDVQVVEGLGFPKRTQTP